MKKQNSRFAKELGDIDPPWVRIEDFAKLKIKRPAVLINGTFDFIHSGHIKLVAHARKHGRTVVVAIDSDRRVRSLKTGRPFLTWVERAVQFRFLPVDIIVEVDSDDDFKRLVELLKPDLRVRGAEYANKSSRIPDIPSLYIHDTSLHTTDIIERILASSESNPRGTGGASHSNGLDDRHSDELCSTPECEGVAQNGRTKKSRKRLSVSSDSA